MASSRAGRTLMAKGDLKELETEEKIEEQTRKYTVIHKIERTTFFS